MFLKILGATLLAITLLIIIVLFSSVKFKISSKSGEDVKLNLALGILKTKDKKQKKSNKSTADVNKPKDKKAIPDNVKRMLGIDKFDSIKKLKTNLKESGFDGTFGKTVSIAKFLLKQAGKLICRIKLKVLKISYVHAGADAAEVAVNYGILCAFVYPFATFVKESTKSKKSKFSVDLSCNFEEKEPSYEFYLEVKLKIIYALIIFIKTLSYIAKENANEEQQISRG